MTRSFILYREACLSLKIQSMPEVSHSEFCIMRDYILLYQKQCIPNPPQIPNQAPNYYLNIKWLKHSSSNYSTPHGLIGVPACPLGTHFWAHTHDGSGAPWWVKVVSPPLSISLGFFKKTCHAQECDNAFQNPQHVYKCPLLFNS